MYFYFLEMLVKAFTIPITLKKKKKIEERNNVEEVRKVMETQSSHD